MRKSEMAEKLHKAGAGHLRGRWGSTQVCSQSDRWVELNFTLGTNSEPFQSVVKVESKYSKSEPGKNSILFIYLVLVLYSPPVLLTSIFFLFQLNKEPNQEKRLWFQLLKCKYLLVSLFLCDMNRIPLVCGLNLSTKISVTLFFLNRAAQSPPLSESMVRTSD